MSGDVQPRKRKDKKRKKDELEIEETRGTSAVFGEGDVFIHSQHDHGTGGHWCAKIIFFSLLAVLVTLIGLIILENRGLSELEANSVASSYSGVLEGWLEDVAADHHDEHTLDLKHPDAPIDEITDDIFNDGLNKINEDILSEDEQLTQASEEAKEDSHYYYDWEINKNDDSEAKPYSAEEHYENELQYGVNEIYQNSFPSLENEEEEEADEEDEPDLSVEKIEKEIDTDETVSSESVLVPDLDNDNSSNENDDAEEDDEGEQDEDEDEFSEPYEEIEEAPPVVEHITAPLGKPFRELDEDESVEHPTDTLVEEEEYEKQQEELRQQEEQSSHKDGGNNINDAWPGEPNDPYWREELDQAEQDLLQGSWESAVARASKMPYSGRARWTVAQALDAGAAERRDNRLLTRAIDAYLNLLKLQDGLSDDKLLMVTNRTVDRIQFRGNYMSAEPVYKLLIRRFPDEPNFRNKLSVTYLMSNRADLAENILKETLQRWPEDRVALAHCGFVMKTLHNKLKEAVDLFTKALKDDAGPANEPRFYYHLGDALLLLGRHSEANEVHQRGAALGHFLSPVQRSLYNVATLKSRPWWAVEKTPYVKLARALEKSWKLILKEGEAAQELYEKEKEGLREKGEWSQLDIFVRGREVTGRCSRAPHTCAVVRSEPAANCHRGQVKFSLMSPGTHVRPHVGPTNCRLRMHLALKNTNNTFIRVHNETRQWEVGKVLMFDDSFEHEVWHNGTAARLVLIVDVWHPDLTPAQRDQLPAI